MAMVTNNGGVGLTAGLSSRGNPIMRAKGRTLALVAGTRRKSVALMNLWEGQDVEFRTGWFSLPSLGTLRPSYINAILIQSRGILQANPCNRCSGSGHGPFPECRRVPGHFGGCCGNCKWPDAAISCSVRDTTVPTSSVPTQIDLTLDDDDEPADDDGSSPSTAIVLA